MRLLLLLLALLLADEPAAANDTMAVGAAGGLVFLKSADVEMVSEDLRIASDAIRVRYEFRNHAATPVEALIAFPLPDVDHATDWPIWPPDGMPADNFVGFAATVDGKPIAPRLDARAYLGTVEITDLLKRHGLPLSRFSTDPDLDQRIEALPAKTRQALVKQGILGPGDVSDYFPKWTLKTAFTWTQTFPPGRTVVVEHRYVPVVGGNWIAAEDLASDQAWADYCLDPGTKKAIARRLPAEGSVRATLIDYVLKTGANWAGPIGRFRLTLDKGDAGRLLSVCLDGLRKTGPTTWVWERDAFTPNRDLRIMLIERPHQD
ncbi:MAG TPA: DUF4424 family protein [Azospirillaceae bacterium]|nr:DUF4424 family protein [Azospirillaceae bacterium]